VQVHTEGEGTITQDLAAQDEDLAVQSTSHVLVDGGTLTYDGLVKGHNTGVSTETDLQAQAPEGSVEYILTAGDIVQQASALYEGEEDDEPVPKDEYVTYEQVMNFDNPGFLALVANAPIDLKNKENFMRSILKIKEDVVARAKKIDNFLNARSQYGEEYSKIGQIMELDNAGDFFQDARFHIAYDKNYNAQLVEITYNIAPEPEVQSSLASIPPLQENGDQARFYQKLEAATPGCSSDILYAYDELDVYEGVVQGSYQALIGGVGTPDAYAAIAIDDLFVETTDSGTGSEIRQISGATNGLMSTSSTTHLQTTGSDIDTGASLEGSGTILATDDRAQQRLDIDGSLTSPGNAYFYINSLYGENWDLFNDLEMRYDYGYPGQNPQFSFDGLALARSNPNPQALINYQIGAGGGTWNLDEGATTMVNDPSLLELVEGPSALAKLGVWDEGARFSLEGAIVSSSDASGMSTRITNRNVQEEGTIINYWTKASSKDCSAIISLGRGYIYPAHIGIGSISAIADQSGSIVSAEDIGADGQELLFNAYVFNEENSARLMINPIGSRDDPDSPGNLEIGSISAATDQSKSTVSVNDLQAEGPFMTNLEFTGGKIETSSYLYVPGALYNSNIAFSGYIQDQGSGLDRAVRGMIMDLRAAGDDLIFKAEASNQENVVQLSTKPYSCTGNPASLEIGSISASADTSGSMVRVNDLQAEGPSSIDLSLWGGDANTYTLHSRMGAELANGGEIAFSGYIQDTGRGDDRAVRETTSSLVASGESIDVVHEAYAGESSSKVETIVDNGEISSLYGYAASTPLTMLAYQRAVADGTSIQGIGLAYNPGSVPDTAEGSIEKDFPILFYNRAWTDPDPHEQHSWRIY